MWTWSLSIPETEINLCISQPSWQLLPGTNCRAKNHDMGKPAENQVGQSQNNSLDKITPQTQLHIFVAVFNWPVSLLRPNESSHAYTYLLDTIVLSYRITCCECWMGGLNFHLHGARTNWSSSCSHHCQSTVTPPDSRIWNSVTMGHGEWQSSGQLTKQRNRIWTWGKLRQVDNQYQETQEYTY